MVKTSGHLGEGVWDRQSFLGVFVICQQAEVVVFVFGSVLNFLDGSDFMTLELNQQLADL